MVTPEGQPLRILMVDDQDHKLSARAAQVKFHGNEVRPHLRPAEALQEYGQHPEQYDVVFTDYNMPEIDGGVLAERLRVISGRIPIVMMSGDEFSPDMQHILRQKGVDLFLPPAAMLVDVKRILDEVKQLIQQRQSLPQ